MKLQFSITISLSFFTAGWYVVTKGNILSAVEKNGCNVLLVRIPDDFRIGQRSCKSLQGETNGLQLSPSRALNTFRLRSMLVKYQFIVRFDKCTTR